MSGETNLSILLKNMQPELVVGDYVFCLIDNETTVDASQIIMLFHEKEGTTLIMKKEVADQLGFEYSYVAAMITLNVHSALEAVGLTAAVAAALAHENISCNVVAAYYHDHIFVAQADATRAINALLVLINAGY
jgi:uncharacterized protein